MSHDWHDLRNENECFYLRVYAPGDYRFKGADLGILVTKGRMQTPEGLTLKCRQYIKGIRDLYVSEPLEPATGRHAALVREVSPSKGAGSRSGL